MRIIILITCFFVPQAAFAAVVVSEVAWMGSSVSANHEWIELQNTSDSAVDVSGWTLSDGMNLSIPLAGVVPALGYVVLERTSDASAASSAFLIYTGALVNTGATFVLRRADGGIEDQVAGGEDWEAIGGDNITKETAQYTSAGWVTGVGTPGSSNAGSPKTTPTTETKATTPTTRNAASQLRLRPEQPAVRFLLPGVTLMLAIEGQSVGYVHQVIPFVASSSGIGPTLESSLSYEWNFGDGTTGKGKTISHEYEYPGTYVVVLFASYARQKQITRHEVTILPVTLSVTHNERGDIQINNDAPYELDISGYQLQGEKTFTFPRYSVLLANQTVTVPQSKVEAATPRVKDAQGTVLGLNAKQNQTQRTESSPVGVVSPQTSTPDQFFSAITKAPLLVKEKISFWHPPMVLASGTTTTTTLSLAPSSPIAEYVVAPKSSSTAPISRPAWPYIALIGVILVGLIGTAGRFGKINTFQ